MTDEPRITASSNPTVAQRHGLTEWDRDRGQWVRPAEPAPEVDDAEDYSTLTVAELKTELDNREITYPRNAVRADLIQALEDDDLAN